MTALLATGPTNDEVRATVSLTANAIGHHLRKVFDTLGLSSRPELQPRWVSV